VPLRSLALVLRRAEPSGPSLARGAAALARPPEKAAVSLAGAGTIVSAIPSAAGAALTR